MLDRRTFLRTTGLSALALGAGTTLLPAATATAAAGETLLPTTWQQQSTLYWCGPTAVAIALSARGEAPTPDSLAGELGTTDDGTTFGAISPVLNAHTPDKTYTDHFMESMTATKEDADLLWQRATNNADNGFATVVNWWVLPGEYPGWGGNDKDVQHFLTIDGYNADEGTLRIADPAGATLSDSLPQRQWLSAQQVATFCAGRGYFW
ncbi:hypothetical protein DEO23_03565 [Brachybacterium endophyticum]|uniref:Peptidase C39-like domain-containing protein n=1 Tax=Brachybacterium endophyticum TaxID=2182385 RepID=A0A2U2RPC0_9MICO|nr:C39 family peptidase [Brachybacterium endophyticum]PWH07709.1 hypothetical protein DEO23_03565 [Brachybacterium endophyticum]